MERKKTRQIRGRISSRNLVHNATIKHTINKYHTKYDYSSLTGFTEILDETFHFLKYGKKVNSGENMQQNDGLPFHDTTYCNRS